jgi:hypothetical protein
VRFEVFTAMIMKIALLWDVAPCGGMLRHYVPEDDILYNRLHSHCHENLRSYIAVTGWGEK